jgi:hypothetical protein
MISNFESGKNSAQNLAPMSIGEQLTILEGTLDENFTVMDIWDDRGPTDWLDWSSFGAGEA